MSFFNGEVSIPSQNASGKGKKIVLNANNTIDWTLTFPDTSGNNNQVLTAVGDGTYTWTDSSGSVAKSAIMRSLSSDMEIDGTSYQLINEFNTTPDINIGTGFTSTDNSTITINKTMTIKISITATMYKNTYNDGTCLIQVYKNDVAQNLIMGIPSPSSSPAYYFGSGSFLLDVGETDTITFKAKEDINSGSSIDLIKNANGTTCVILEEWSGGNAPTDPGGSANSIQFQGASNDFSGNSNLQYNSTTNKLTFSGSTSLLDISAQYLDLSMNLQVDGTADISENLTLQNKIIMSQGVKIGDASSGEVSQNSAAIAIGQKAGYSNQDEYAISIGYQAGNTDQSDNSIAIGYKAGSHNQSEHSIAIGYEAGRSNQQEYSIAIGYQVGRRGSQSTNAIGIGYWAGISNQLKYSIAIGSEAGASKQNEYSIAMGCQAGESNQDVSSIAIGYQAGQIDQSYNSIAIGTQSGQTSQQYDAIAIGYQAGNTSQQNSSIAIGHKAGSQNQKQNSVAIGIQAGWKDQSDNSIAMGFLAGMSSQKDYCIAIGSQAGKNSQNEYSVAIGYNAGFTDLCANTIVINAQSTTLDASTNGNAFYVAPVRDVSANSSRSNFKVMVYDSTNKEIAFDSSNNGTGGGGSTNAGGSDTQLQYNSGGTEFGGTTGLTWDGTNLSLLGHAGLQDVSAQYLDLSMNLQVDGSANITGNLDVDGTATLVTVDINAGNIDNTAIGSTTPLTGAFTTLSAAGHTALQDVSAQYLDLSMNLQVDGSANITGNLDVAGDIRLPDNATIKLGDDDNLKLYHVADGDSYLKDDGTGNLILQTNGTLLTIKTPSDTMANFNRNGSVDLYYNGVRKFETSSTGINIHDSIDLSGQIIMSEGIKIGDASSGEVSQNSAAIAIGQKAGYTNQQLNAIAIGNEAGLTSQQHQTIAIGYQAGKTNQQLEAIAMGYGAGSQNQQDRSIAIGYYAGSTDQSDNSIAIGYYAGSQNQYKYAIAIGHEAGISSQNEYSISIGSQAGKSNQKTRSIAIGEQTGKLDQATLSIAIGYETGENYQATKSIAIGYAAAKNSQASQSIAIGNTAGWCNQQENSIAIGTEAGVSYQQSNSIAIGNSAGSQHQQTNAIAIGTEAGDVSQNTYTIAMGYQAGQTSQATKAIAIGHQAGQSNQQTNAIAIGNQAGDASQNQYSIAMGYQAGSDRQGQYSIAIGHQAGIADLCANTIVINAQSSALNSDASNAFYVAPVRDVSNASKTNLKQMYYNNVTKEIAFDSNMEFSYITTITDLSDATTASLPRDLSYSPIIAFKLINPFDWQTYYINIDTGSFNGQTMRLINKSISSSNQYITINFGGSGTDAGPIWNNANYWGTTIAEGTGKTMIYNPGTDDSKWYEI